MKTRACVLHAQEDLRIEERDVGEVGPQPHPTVGRHLPPLVRATVRPGRLDVPPHQPRVGAHRLGGVPHETADVEPRVLSREQPAAEHGRGVLRRE